MFKSPVNRPTSNMQQPTYHGKCFQSLQQLKKEIKSCTIVHRYRNDVAKEMKHPLMVNILFELNRASSNGYKTLEDAYCNYVESLFNMNPSQARESFNKGLHMIDNLEVKTFYLLESYFDVHLNLFDIRVQLKHAKSYSSLIHKSRKNKKHLYSISFPINTCRKQKCYFFITRYSSALQPERNKIINVLFPSFDTNTKNQGSSLLLINNYYLFKKRYQPLIGLANDCLLTADTASVNKSMKECLGIDNEENAYIEELLNASQKYSAQYNMVLLKPISFCSKMNIDRKTVNTCYIVLKVIEAKPKSINTKVFILDKLSSENYNIFESCVEEIENMYQLGYSNTLTKLSEVKGLQTNGNKSKPISEFKDCPCEHFSKMDTNKVEYDFKSCKQRPLRFNKKCLPIQMSLFDLDTNPDFKKRIRLASRVSHTFYDIESLQSTVLKSKTKQPGIYLNFNEFVNTITGYHKIIMIGYSDLVNDKIIDWCASPVIKGIDSLEKLLVDKNEKTFIFHLEKNEIHDCSTEPTFTNQTELIRRFFEFVYERSLMINRVKMHILQPITEYLHTLYKLEQSSIKRIDDDNSSHKTEIQRLIDALDCFRNETILWGFNSAKYDNVIVMPYLKYLLNNNKDSLFYYRNIKIFRRGRHITDLSITKDDIKVKCRDFLHIENPYTSLEDMAQKYNIKHSKAVFPHKLSESVQKLKTTEYVPFEDKYWEQLNGSYISREKRLTADKLFASAGVSNMYEYMEFYLKLDVLCLQECLFAYQNLLYETEGWDIAANKMLTISTLMYEINYKQEFANSPFTLSVFEIKNPFIKHALEMSIIGGITICMFSGIIGKCLTTNTYPTNINSHLQYKDVKHIGPKWPGLYMLKNELEESLGQVIPDQTKLIPSPVPARFVHSYDMLSLYASAMYHDIPVGPCRQWNFGYKDEFSEFQPNCPLIDSFDPTENNFFYRTTVSTDSQECRFISEYLHSFEFSKYKDIRIRSQFHVGGNVCFEYNSYPDLFIKGRCISTNTLTYFVVHFDGMYYHGSHDLNCILSGKNTLVSQEKKSESDIKHNRRRIFYKTFLSLRPIEEKVLVNYEVYTACQMGYCNNKVNSEDIFSFPTSKYKLSHEELLAGVLHNHIRGFIVVQNLKVKMSDRNPAFGFAIQKTQLRDEWLSVHTKSLLELHANHKNVPKQRLLKELLDRQKILGLHSYENTIVLHTDYFLFLYTNFNLNDDFQIAHVLEFVHSDLLRKKVDYYINRRFEIKEKIKLLEKTDPSNPNLSYLKAFSSVLKLYNNSLYGFTLLRADNYKSTRYIISHRIDFINKDNVIKARLIKRLTGKTFLVSVESRNISNTTQAHVGSTIMFRSKITFLNAIIFLLQNSNPRYFEILYTDTDSVHCATHYKELDSNMLSQSMQSYLLNKDSFFYSDKTNTICGVLDLEAISETHRYITEKMYQKFTSGHYITAAKGINRYAKKIHLENTSKENIFNTVTHPFSVTSNLILSDSSDNMVTKSITREFTSGLIPTKRYFTSDGHSVVFQA